ncbi:hypothetical protein [Photobacterium leiognathi]|uniref:hypothetical protein n=1 Tax=Photobacterium leiognathi TaxID=553611 RepID=UPI002980D100|nr:hypothetical protein [Photobacterium leiognathi]
MSGLEEREPVDSKTEKERFHEEFLAYEQKLGEQIKRKEKLEREKYVRSSFLNSLVITLTIVTAATATFTYYIQDKTEQEIDSVLARQVSLSSQELKKMSMVAETKLSSLIQELNAQKDAISNIEVSDDKSNLNQQVAKDLASISVRLTNTESELRALNQAKLPSKLAMIEESIQGSTEQLLSVPMIRNDFKNYKSITEKEILRLEKGIEKLESRLNFFVTTTVTLSLGIFAAVAAPIMNSYSKRRKSNDSA